MEFDRLSTNLRDNKKLDTHSKSPKVFKTFLTDSKAQKFMFQEVPVLTSASHKTSILVQALIFLTKEITSKYLNFIAEPINRQLKNPSSKINVFKTQGQSEINKISIFSKILFKKRKKGINNQNLCERVWLQSQKIFFLILILVEFSPFNIGFF